MKRFLLITIFITSSFFSFAQIDYYNNPTGKKDTTEFKRQLNYGFDLGLSFGQVTYIGSSVHIAYPVTSYNSVGVGVNFTYYKIAGFEQNIIYGASFFDELYIFKMFIIHSEIMVFSSYDILSNNRIWDYALYLGPGFKQSMGKKAYVTYLVLWDFNYNENSIFSNPRFKISFYF